MNAVERQMREGLAGLDRALEAFGDPAVEDVPGLRLMRDAVRRKRDDMAGKLASAEACRLDVVVGGGAVSDDGVDPVFLSELVAAVVESVAGLAETLAADAPRDQLRRAVELRVEGVPDDGPGVRFRAAPPDVRATLTVGRTPLVEAAVKELLAAARKPDDDRLDGLRTMRDRAAATLHFVLHAPFADPRSVDLA